MAWYPPPPCPITPRIELVKNWVSKRAMPLASTVITTDTSGAIAIRNAVVTTTVTSRSVALRAPSTTRETT